MYSEIWSFLEIDSVELDDTACKMAYEARRTANIFNADPCGVIFGSCNSTTLGKLRWYGLKKLYLFPTDSPPSPEIIAHSLHRATVSIHPQFILFAHTPFGTEVGARVAALLKRGFISKCVDFASEEGKPVARKPIYGGKVDAHITWMTPPSYLATIDLSSLEDVKTNTKTELEVIHIEIKETPCLTRLIKKWNIALSELDLSEASIIIGVGKGVSPEFMATVKRLARLLNGVIGGTRIAVYSGLIPLERQIGTTGKWLNSDVYITIGISGAPQHVMGIKEVKHIIAVNRDRRAPIFQYANLGIVCDLYKVIPLLITLIEKQRDVIA